MRVAIVGLGFRLGYLAAIFTVTVPGFSITGYVDPAPAGLSFTQEHNISVGEAYDSLDEMLARADFDVLMVGSPNHLHLEHIEKGLRAGKKIFTEKPVVSTVADTMALARLLREYGPDQVMVGLVLRYAPLYIDLRKAQSDGLLGDIVSIEASEHIAPYHGAFFMRDWRRYSHYAGGFMLEKCCHDLDLYNGVMGSRPRFVASFGGRKSFVPKHAPLPSETNDLALYHRKKSGWQASDKVFDSDGDLIDFQTAMVQYDNGAALSFHTNLNVPDQFRRFCVIGSHGMAEGDFVRNYLRVHEARSSAKLIDTTYQPSELSEHYGADEQMARDIAAHVEQGAALPVSVVDAMEAGLLAITLDEARRRNQVIDMAPLWAAFDQALGRTSSSQLKEIA